MRLQETGEARAQRLIRQLEGCVRRGVQPLRSDARLLELVGALHAARDRAQRIDDSRLSSRLSSLARAATQTLQRSIRRSPDRVVLARAVLHHRLDGTETECLLLVAHATLGREKSTSLGELQASLSLGNHGSLRVVRALSPESRLVRKKLACVDEDRDGDVGCSRVRLHPDLLAALLGRRTQDPWREVDSQERLLERMGPLFSALESVASELLGMFEQASSSRARAVSRRDQLLAALQKTLAAHGSWSFTGVWRRSSPIDFGMLVAIVGHELGYGISDPAACSGRSIAAAVSDAAEEVADHLRRLGPHGWLRSEGLVRVCGGEGEIANVDDAGAIATCKFELTDRAVKLLGLVSGRRRRLGAREPRVRLDQLVLGERVADAVRMAIAQARHADVLFKTWGLGEVIPYGRGTTLLFTGPPGVGKTATAEAVAHALGRPILATNVADLQSCWVGETEKEIVRAFREAKEANAVLFWDEADSLFHERDRAQHQWEVREVNVLLQEIERFEGVCILATNRKSALDAALERRVSMKVEFERPDQASARAIWRKLLPAKLPLESDVDFEALAAADLSGGQIKNVVLNAARRALLRGKRARVRMEDFTEAVRCESDGQWTKKARVGFATTS
jgi:hypothetical protein